MDKIICKELIVSTLTRRGKGTDVSPIRVITQVFEKDGTLIAETDPCPDLSMDMVFFARWLKAQGIDPDKASTNHIGEWIQMLDKNKNP